MMSDLKNKRRVTRMAAPAHITARPSRASPLISPAANIARATAKRNSSQVIRNTVRTRTLVRFAQPSQRAGSGENPRCG